MIINTLALDPENKSRLVTSGWDGRVKLWDLDTKQEVAQVELGFYINHLVWGPPEGAQENVIIYAGGKDGNIVKIRL